MRRDTICAIATPGGAGERAVLRLSGPAVREVLARCVRFDDPSAALAARGVFGGRLDDGTGSQPTAVWWMPGPRSYTREDVAELHTFGAEPLVRAALERLLACGARLASPGEFTRRAFENGRLDLAQAEGVLALVRAANDTERRAGLERLAGGLGQRTAAIRDALEELRALCEASLDFDEADTGHVPVAELRALAERAAAALDEALSWETRREPASSLARALLVGEPNAGKSTLFNALVVAGQALTSAAAGTTRDWLVGRWPLGPSDARDGGAALLLVDTPGLEAGSTPAERRAQELAARERGGVDLFVLVRSASAPASAATRLEIERALERDAPGTPIVRVWSQTDRAGAAPPPSAAWIPTAVRGGLVRGLDELGVAAARALGLATADAERGGGARPGTDGGSCEVTGDPAGGARRELGLRHRKALLGARAELDRARAGLDAGAPLDLVAEGLRAATAELDQIAGRTVPEDLLDRIFARFCLGK